ncbi:6-carboxytetrahydropterin synthase [Paraflavisolibacter sp. H34]|uniref:6-pyruvoyl trahydropterin synthase family protein n=1 Tax=Huijunlia imazamoxiresistens TaxID=3127457 RepID=UPI00301A9EA3
MLKVTKIVRFEMAHALHGYEGPCHHIHGHSYELHVTVQPASFTDEYVPAPGFVIDFRQLKELVQSVVLRHMDHQLFLSPAYLQQYGPMGQLSNLEIFPAEPSAENLLLYIARQLRASLPRGVVLRSLRLYETRDSYAEWEMEGIG